MHEFRMRKRSLAQSAPAGRRPALRRLLTFTQKKLVLYKGVALGFDFTTIRIPHPHRTSTKRLPLVTSDLELEGL